MSTTIYYASEDVGNHPPPAPERVLAKLTLVPFVRSMSCGAQIGGYEDECASDGAVEPLTCGCSHAGDGEINEALGKVMRRDRQVKGRVTGKLVVGLAIFVIGTSWFEGCEIGVAVMLYPRGKHEHGKRDEGPH